MTGEALYRKVADDIKAAIGAGAYPPGALLPSESELAERYAVSRGTIRQAFAALRADGVIASRRGARRVVIGGARGRLRLLPGPGAAAVRPAGDDRAGRLPGEGRGPGRGPGPGRRLDHPAPGGALRGRHERRGGHAL